MTKSKALMSALILVILIFSFAFTVNADEVISGKCGNNLTWEIKDHTLYIKGKGQMKNFAKGEAPWIAYKDKFHSLVIEEGVSSIGTYAFNGLRFDDYWGYIGVPSEIREASVTFPSTLAEIKQFAFTMPLNCKIYIPSIEDWCQIRFDSYMGNPLGSGGLCLIEDPETQVVHIKIPDNIRFLYNTFSNYSDLKTVTIPGSVKSISLYAFSGCRELTAVFFTGDAPKFSENENIFALCDTKIFYPEGNKTWTEEIMQNYEGELTWIPYTPNDTTEFLVQPSHQSLFAGNFINIKVAATGEGLTYRWQLKKKGSDEWNDLENIKTSGKLVQANSSELIIDPVLPEHEGKLRCIATNPQGEEFISDEATLSLLSTECKDYAPTLVKDTFRYLDEFYIDKYPELGLINMFGTEEDQRQIKILTEAIAEGCTTETEKADAAFLWVKNNLSYDGGGISAHPIDVLIDRSADCRGNATLLQAILREMGIPAVIGNGWRGNMNICKTEQLQSMAGHAWCFAYLNGEWVLYDPLWENGKITDREYIANWYYLEAVDHTRWVTPVYDDAPLPPTRNPFYYFDGKYWYHNEKHILVEATKPNANLTPYRPMLSIPSNSVQWYYRNAKIESGHIGQSYDVQIYSYCNDCCSIGTNMMTYRDGICFFNNHYKVTQPIESYNSQNGHIAVPVGFNGYLGEPAMFIFSDDNKDIVYSYESDHPEIISVDENGNYTAHKEGSVLVTISSMESSTGKVLEKYFLYLNSYEGSREPDFSNHAVASHTHEYTEIIIPSTCVTRGTVICTCTYEGCTETYEKERLPLSGHNMCEWYVTKEATCEEEGEELSSCVKCDVTESRVISKLEHTYNKEVIAPTCTEEGYTVNTCTICGEIYTSDAKKVIAHSFGEWKTLEVATKDKNGKEERKCTDCGETEKRDIIYEETFFEKQGTVIIISSVSVFIIIAGAIIFIVVKKRR
ncbi:MAG: leucine-rich repeat protein [Clostridia bacterium]|nr:leucine-rich repeat protein [Clostridia bacterium]